MDTVGGGGGIFAAFSLAKQLAVSEGSLVDPGFLIFRFPVSNQGVKFPAIAETCCSWVSAKMLSNCFPVRSESQICNDDFLSASDISFFSSRQIPINLERKSKMQ